MRADMSLVTKLLVCGAVRGVAPDEKRKLTVCVTPRLLLRLSAPDATQETAAAFTFR